MDKSMNSLPTRIYVRSRASTIVRDVGDAVAGNVVLDLAKPSDVTVVTVCSTATGLPELFIAAIGRQPSLADLDVIISPADFAVVKGQGDVTLRLPAGQTTFYWKALSLEGEAQEFPEMGSRLVLAIDQ
jgi:hypothetical protein